MKNKIHITLGLLILFVAFLSAQSQVFTGKVVVLCTDSDNADLEVKGATTFGTDQLEDYCEGDTLVEYFCSQNKVEVKVFPCPFSCTDGACSSAAAQPTLPIEKTVKLDAVNDQIEIGEFIGDVRESIVNLDTNALNGGIVSTKSGSTLFSQYLRFKATDLLDGRVIFAEDEDNIIGDFLYFRESEYAFEYELQFANGFESAISATNLPDLVDESVSILDREYRVTKATVNGNSITLHLIAGEVPSTINEGETKRYVLNGNEISIEVLSIDDTKREVLFNINDEKTVKLGEGEIAFVAGTVIGVRTILLNEAAEGKDFVTLYLGTERIEFNDNDYTDDTFQQSIDINGMSISEGYTKIKGTQSGNDLKISSIKYRMKPDAENGKDIYIPPEKGLKELLRHPEAMLANWDIRYRGLSSQGTTARMNIDSAGDDKYDVEFENVKGNQYDIPFVANSGGNLVIGDSSATLHFIEGTATTDYLVAQNDYIVLTNKNDRTGITNIIRYSSIDTSGKTLHFNEESEGSKTVPYAGTEGTGATGDIIVAGTTYKAYIGPAPDYKLAIDINSDGDVASDEANIVIKGGGLLDLGSTITPMTDFDITLTTQAKQFDSSSSDEVITINILAAGSEVDLNLPAQTGLSIESGSGKNLALSNYGVFFTQKKDDPDQLFIDYPESQAVADISLVFFETPSSAAEIKTAPIKTAPQPPPPTPAPITKEPEPTKIPPTTELPVPQRTQPQPVRLWRVIWETIKQWLF